MCFGIRFYKSCGCPGLSLPACPLVGMTPPPGSLLRKQGKPGQVYYSQQIGKIKIPYFAPPAASRISTKTLCPASIRPDPLRPDRKIDKKKRKQLFTTSLRRPFFGHRKIICDSELNSCDTTYSCESLSL